MECLGYGGHCQASYCKKTKADRNGLPFPCDMKLLVFGSSQEPHVSSVLKCLSQEFQVDSTLIDFGAQSRTGLVLSESDGVEITFPDQSEDRYSAIWNRIKLKLPVGSSGQKYRAEYVTRRQQFAFFHSVCDLLAVRVVNHPTSHRESKLHDLNVASQVGFRVPHTIIPASKQKIMDEMQTGRSFIMKSLADPNTPLGDAEGGTRVIMTARVTPQELVEIEDERLTVCPHLFQEEIAKDLEIRVVATRSRYFAFSTDAHTNYRAQT